MSWGPEQAACRDSSPCLSSGTQYDQHSIQKMRKACGVTVDHLDHLPSYEEFFLHYLLPNRPCVLSSQATKGWKSRKEWVTPGGRPDLDFLKKQFGCATVPVADCSQEKFSSHPKTEMKFSEYIKYWQDFIYSQYSGKKLLYLKDWHFAREFPEYTAYSTPVYFKSDWLNEFWDCGTDEGDDYRFVYMGPKGTWTPLHADVFRSYSWSANICGRKKWIFYPPGEEKCLTDVFGQLAFSVTSDELRDQSKYPNFKHLQHQIEVIQEKGEIIFVPSGWHHQVFNVEDTISINHNWINGCNIDLCWCYISQCLSDVQKEIVDCQDMDGWHSQCQLILKASSGIDFIQFIKFLSTIAQHRLHALTVYSQHVNQAPKANCVKLTSSTNDDRSFQVLPCDGFHLSCTGCDRDTAVCPEKVHCIRQSSDMNYKTSDTHTSASVNQIDIKLNTCDSDGSSHISNRKENSTDCDNRNTDVCAVTSKKFDLNLGDSNICHSNLLDLSMDCLSSGYIHWRLCNIAHAKFDLERVRYVMNDIINTPVMMEINAGTEVMIADDILKQIKNILDH